MHTTNQKNISEFIIDECSSGRWDAVKAVKLTQIEKTTDRSRLALYLGVAKIRGGSRAQGMECIEQAREWGASLEDAAQLLFSSIHRHLAVAELALQDPRAAIKQLVLAAACQSSDEQPLARAQADLMLANIEAGNIQDAYAVMEAQLKEMSAGRPATAEIEIFSSELRTIRGELALAQQRGLLSAALSQSGPIENETSKRHAQTGSMSQLGQDMWVIEKCKFKRGGYFVEFGATDGVLLSNTWLLEKKYGWTGICAEPNPEFFSRLKINRSCTVVDSCIGKNTGEEVEFIFADVYGGNEKHMSDDKHGDKRRLYRDLGRTAKLRTISLHDLLKEHEAPHTIDYISIDIEGGEYEVLSGFPFSSWDVRYLTIEHNFGARREDIFNIMTRNGYRRTEMKWDDWYEKIV
ncbi:methyltransferase FkbM domain protein [Bordetella hinzii 4161]|nr:methyltransferase FkbM domain protein [Bordetella hinzii 4161]QDJ55489.1 hypothetical protein CBR72_11970 [Bordetella hinzii]VEH25608.1 methyltransferase, FkbM family [Bordetella hinzii]